MRKYLLILLILLLPSLSTAQYWGERATEKSFEKSAIFFKSHYLNTFGVYRFSDVAAGLVEDPFLQLYLNPANLPDFGTEKSYFYLDFRGDRTEPKIVQEYSYPIFYDYYLYCPPIDPRWYNISRKEPEPIFSMGMLSYPFGDKLLLGGTYQIIHKDEKFYEVPAWIYNYRGGYDSFGLELAVGGDIPIEDRAYGEDEMMTQAHLLSAFAGYKISDRINAGLSLNSVTHSREGSYINSRKDEYSTDPNHDSRYYRGQERDQDYDHIDLSGGVRIQFDDHCYGGIKIGHLSGEADQDYLSERSSLYHWNQEGISDEWSYSSSEYSTRQNWNHDGENWYGGFDLSRELEDGKKVSGYYRYTHSDIDLTNSSSIQDTGYYSSQHYNSWDSTYYYYRSKSSTRDMRSGSGNRKEALHEIMATFKWNVSPKNTVSAGFYIKKRKSDINSSEPVLADRFSEYHNVRYGNNYNRLYEDKRLEWQYDVDYWSIQIPILLKFRLNKHWSATVGVNRILESWDVSDQTTAYYAIREQTYNDEITTETDFGERYTEPAKKITEDYTDVITNFEVAVSPQLNIRLQLDPEFEPDFRVAQWWLSFQSKI